MRFSYIVVAGGILGLAGSCFAQRGIAGYHTYPQFRNMSGLPGGGFPVSMLGNIDIHGAMAYSTPIAYGLAGKKLVFGLATTSNDFRLQFPRKKGKDLANGNGTAQILYGIDLKNAGRITPSVMILSGVGDSAFNLHWTLPPMGSGAEHLTYAVGLQDLRGNGGSSGDHMPGENDNSTSFYGVATFQFNDYDAYMSLGYGTKRFKGLFVNGSITVLPNLKGYVEYDTFNINAGLGWAIGLAPNGRSSMIAHAGVIRGKYLSASVNFGF